MSSSLELENSFAILSVFRAFVLRPKYLRLRVDEPELLTFTHCALIYNLALSFVLQKMRNHSPVAGTIAVLLPTRQLPIVIISPSEDCLRSKPKAIPISKISVKCQVPIYQKTKPNHSQLSFFFLNRWITNLGTTVCGRCPQAIRPLPLAKNIRKFEKKKFIKVPHQSAL